VRPIIAAHVAKSQILAIMENATQSLDITTHALSDADYESAIANAARRGVQVRIVFSDPSFGGRPENEASEFRVRVNALGHVDNIEVIFYENRKLQRGTNAHRPGQHAKLVLADTGTPNADGYIGDATLYTWQEGSAAGYQWCNSVGVGLRVRGPSIASLADFFRQLAEQQIPTVHNSPDSQLQLLSSRDSSNNLKESLLADLAAAQETVTVVQYSLQDSDVIRHLVWLSRTRPDVRIRVYLGRMYRRKGRISLPHNALAYMKLRAAGIDVRFVSDGLFVHGKGVFVDDVAHIGSADLTPRGLEANIEANLRLVSSKLTQELAARIDSLHQQGLAPQMRFFERCWVGAYGAIHTTIRGLLGVWNSRPSVSWKSVAVRPRDGKL